MTEIQAKVVEYDLFPHPNADLLSIAMIRGKGWQCVVKTSDMIGKQLAVYIPIDGEVPTEKVEFRFLADKAKNGRYRIRTVRLRGSLSQGLLLPAPEGAKLGDDLTEELGVTRWEPAIPAHMAGDMIREPGNFHKYTSIENYKNFPNVFQDGDCVRMTEKLHGCVIANSKITLVDGTKKKINQIKIGEIVLGVNKNNQIVPTTVTNIFNNGKCDKWLRVEGTRTKMSRSGNYFFAVYCTPNHRFWNPQKQVYIPASELVVNDAVLVHATNIVHSELQNQVLLGIMLGDGHLCLSGNTGAVAWGHVNYDKNYLEWKRQALGDIIRHPDSEFNEYISGYGSLMLRDATIFAHSIKEQFATMINTNGVKYVPEWVAESLTPLSLAFWYMDDGSLGYHEDQESRANFAVCSFSREDCEVLMKGLRKFGIDAIYFVDTNGYSRLRLNAQSAERLFLLIAPYIPPCMQRKLPERYRGHSGWLPKPGSAYFTSVLVKQTITSVQVNNSKLTESSRYDLETGTHNYFVNGVLTHNSNTRLGYVDDGLIGGLTYFVGSHKTARAKDGTNIYSQMSRKLGIEEKLLPFVQRFAVKQHLIVYGEIYGWKVQDLTYGCAKNEQQFRIFDILIDHVYQPWDIIEEISTALGVRTVPLLYRGPFLLAEAFAHRDGRTTLGEANIREGVVVTAEPETIHQDVGRKVIKFISDEYLLRKNATDGH